MQHNMRGARRQPGGHQSGGPQPDAARGPNLYIYIYNIGMNIIYVIYVLYVYTYVIYVSICNYL